MNNKIKNALKAEFITGTKPFDWIFLSIGLVLQAVGIIVAAIVPEFHDDYLLITAISGISGVISVVLCSRGKLSQYVFGYVQLFTYLFGVAIPLGLGGETFENVVYAVTMVIGIIVWIKRYRNKDGEAAIATKEMGSNAWTVSVVVMMLCIVGVALLFENVPSVNIWLTGSENPNPWMDSITTVVPLVGQMLMCFGYKDQWVFWFIEDVMSLIMFIMLGQPIMIAQYIFWTANTVYGWLIWNKSVNERERN